MFFSAGADRNQGPGALVIRTIYVCFQYMHVASLTQTASLSFFREHAVTYMCVCSAGADRNQGTGAFIIRIMYVFNRFMLHP